MSSFAALLEGHLARVIESLILEDSWRAVTGNTYPVKDKLKSLGARWDAANKQWLVKPEHYDKAMTIVRGSSTTSSNTKSTTSSGMSGWVPITGDTYHVKEKLRAIGGRWDADRKAWLVHPDKKAAAMEIMKNAPKVAKSTSHGYGHGGCSCDDDCCRPRCKCESNCNCRGGNVYDC